ncbi:hypothetical protein N7478_010523 [Penicillium angulare]|uniref:uncharacterized protein n=1 Tax=Penicillium angulare TaxID=116970 RepID=UPI00253FE4DF|nr:uncharacterized protein N7478_010523 [Penicillium angulare]KAJ5267715.1 hypothetical protein N7478_010523 [Penicillium angulare]
MKLSREEYASNSDNQVVLPPPLQFPILGPIDAPEESPPTFHQLLLVLNYIFISAMLPKDDAAIWRIVFRQSAD